MLKRRLADQRRRIPMTGSATSFAAFSKAVFRRRGLRIARFDNRMLRDIGIAPSHRIEPDMDELRARMTARFPW